MRTVDRMDFMPLGTPAYMAYQDSPQGIKYGATISAPHMHAYCLEWLTTKLVPGASVLDVGCGSGYLLAAFYEMVNKESKAHVIGIEHIDELAEFSVRNLSKSYADKLKNGDIRVVCGDGRKGFKEGAPYDVIHVGAAAPDIPYQLL